MEETHELGGTTVAVDRATPKEDDPPPRPPPAARIPRAHPWLLQLDLELQVVVMEPYNAYISAATRYAALGAPTLYDNAASFSGIKTRSIVIRNKRINQNI